MLHDARQAIAALEPARACGVAALSFGRRHHCFLARRSATRTSASAVGRRARLRAGRASASRRWTRWLPPSGWAARTWGAKAST